MYIKVAGHAEDEHMCSALVHMCGEVCYIFGGEDMPRLLTSDIASRALLEG
jgi:hypothetical protein